MQVFHQGYYPHHQAFIHIKTSIALIRGWCSAQIIIIRNYCKVKFRAEEVMFYFSYNFITDFVTGFTSCKWLGNKIIKDSKG